LDAANVRAFEKHFGVRLPDDYVAFLHSCNGGWLDARYFTDPRGAISEINDLYGLGTPQDDAAAREKDASSWHFGNLWGEMRVYGPALGEGRLPVARDGGDNQLYLNLNTDPPSVWRYVVATQTHYAIAPSIEAFLDMLRKNLE
jgi:hypothetical protein